MQSNATDSSLAQSLSEIAKDLPGQGNLVSITLKKKGVTRGPAGAKIIYGDDFVHVLIWTGFYYAALVERSFKRLHFLWSQGTLLQDLVQKVQTAGYDTVTLQDAAEAVQEIDDGFLRILHGIRSRVPPDPLAGFLEKDEDEPEDKPLDAYARPHVWEPLKVNGRVVPGSKVYVGPGDPNNPHAPVKGEVYVDGVKLGERVLTPAPNGPWEAPKRKPKAVAKDILKGMLPVGLYVRYCLSNANLLTLKLGHEAGEEAKKAGVHVEPEAIRSLFKVAP